MNRRFFVLTAFCLVSAPVVLRAENESAQPGVEIFRAFATKYCADCHGGAEPEGELKLEHFGDSQWRDGQLLNKVLSAIEEGEMPPEGSEMHPTKDETKTIRGQLINRLATLSKTQTPGVLKRLNRTEYQNTINDLFGTDMDIADQLPVDSTSGSFNNTGENLFTSPFALDAYYRVASLVVEEVVGPRPKPAETLHTYKNLGIQKLSNNYRPSADGALMLALDSHSARIMIDVQRAGFYEVKVNGYYHQGALRFGRGGNRGAKRETEVVVPPEFQRLKFAVSPAGNRRQILEQGEFLLKDKYRVYMRSGDKMTVSSYSYAFPLPALAKLSPEERSRIDYPEEKSQFVQRTMFCFASATVTGPHYDFWPPKSPFYDKYFEGVKESDGPKKCKAIIKRLAAKIFRRPVDDQMLAGYYTIADKEYAGSRDIFSGVQSALKAMLCSPDYLYKYEGDGTALDDYAIAARMSHFLWNSLPDDRLFKLAAQGKLQDSEVRRAEALRMLQDPKSDRFVDDFVTQWLELHKLDDINPMPQRYSEKQFARIKPYLEQEAPAFFKEVLHSNLSVTNFIDSDFVMANAELNDIYRLPGRIPGGKLRKIPAADSRRGGLITQAGILLMTTSNGEFTNPFYRGAWIARNLYGEDLEPPNDAVVSALKPPTEAASIQENIQLHRQEKQCNSCHRKLDPFGLALENFDVIGRWRDRYTKVVTTTKMVEVKTKPGQKKKFEEFIQHKLVPTLPVESNTKHDDGRPIAGPEGLKRILMEDKNKIARNLIEKLFTYALGREHGYADKTHIDSLLEDCITNDYKLRNLIVGLVSAKFFCAR